MRASSLLAACFWLGLLLAGCEQKSPSLPPLQHVIAEDISGADYAKDFDLLDHNGRRRHLADFKGKVVAIFFGYTHCPDVCPTTLYDFSVALKMLGADAGKVQVLFVTVDPERDTPAVLAKFVPAFNKQFLGLYTDAANTERVAKQFRIYYHKQDADAAGQYAVDHSAFTYVYDTSGRLRLKMPFAESSTDIANDLRQLLG